MGGAAKIESAPPGWADTVERMKGHGDISNPFALANWMHSRGYKPHRENGTAYEVDALKKRARFHVKRDGVAADGLAHCSECAAGRECNPGPMAESDWLVDFETVLRESLLEAGWDESKHPRAAKGSADGGQFTSGGGGAAADDGLVTVVPKGVERGFKIPPPPDDMIVEDHPERRFVNLDDLTDKSSKINLDVANTISRQLGGAKFRAMTGAKQFVGNNNSLTFALPGKGFAKDGINHVNVTLDPTDTYTITFSRVRGTNTKEISKATDVHAGDLQRVFTMHTGLDTSLGTMGRRESIGASALGQLNRKGVKPPGEGSSTTCPNCGSKLSGDEIAAKYCDSCDRALREGAFPAAKCTKCGGSRFEEKRCLECGAAMESDAADGGEATELCESASGWNERTQLREAAAAEGMTPGTPRVILITGGPGNRVHGNFYPPEILRRDCKVFEGVKSFFDHPGRIEENNRPEREVDAVSGWFSNVEAQAAGDGNVQLVADFNYMRRLGEQLTEAGEKARDLVESAIVYSRQYPDSDKVLLGFSINAAGPTHRESTDELVKRYPQFRKQLEARPWWNVSDGIEQAQSVDLVTFPARGGRVVGLREGGDEADFSEAWQRQFSRALENAAL